MGPKEPKTTESPEEGAEMPGGWERDATLHNPEAAGRSLQILGLEAGLGRKRLEANGVKQGGRALRETGQGGCARTPVFWGV